MVPTTIDVTIFATELNSNEPNLKTNTEYTFLT